MKLKRKKCTMCKIYKSYVSFYKNRSKKYGIDSSCKKCRAEWENKKPDYKKRNYLKVRYKMTLEHYNFMKLKQNEKCRICGLDSKLYVDHDHSSKEIRGLLCNNCNMGLGCFKDSVVNLSQAITYLTMR